MRFCTSSLLTTACPGAVSIGDEISAINMMVQMPTVMETMGPVIDFRSANREKSSKAKISRARNIGN